MLKKLSAKTNFILIGIVVGLFVGVSIRQAFGQTDTSGTARADNLTVNMSANTENGLIVAAGNALVSGNVGIGTLSPIAKLDVVGDIKSTTQLCVGATCVTESELRAMKSQAQLSAHPGVTYVNFTKIGSGTVKIDGSILFFQSGETEAGMGYVDGTLPQTVSLVSVPDSGYKFVKWSGDCSGTGDTCSISLKSGDADRNVTIEFAPTSVVTPPPTVTPGTMTGTGTTSDPYKCPFTYTAAGGGLPGGSCVNRSDVIDTCCKSGSMTSCVPISGGVSIVGSGCNYIDPSSLPEKHLGVAVDRGPAWFFFNPMSGFSSRLPGEVGSFCQYGSHDWVYEQAPYTDKDGNVVAEPKIYSGNDCLDKIDSTGWCYRAEKWVNPCIN